MKKTIFKSVAVISIMLSCIITTACNPDINKYCAELTDCEKLNDYDENACVDEKTAEREASDAYGCKDQFDKWVECLAEKSVCLNPNEDNRNYTSEDKCSDISDDYTSCLNDE